jgi:hypothetical protein
MLKWGIDGCNRKSWPRAAAPHTDPAGHPTRPHRTVVMITTAAEGVVYRNPKPYLRSVHTWHPTVARLDSGELVVAFDAGQAVEALDYHSRVVRSTDDGHTWSEPVPILRESLDRPTTYSLRISRVGDGLLVAFGGRYYRDPEEGQVNRANLGYVPMDLILLRSGDGGRTWSMPETITPPLVGPSWESCHRVVELSDGRWLAPTSTWRGWDGAAPNGMGRAVAFVSRDRGRTWPEAITVFDACAEGVISWEQSVEPLPDGRLLAVCWAYHEPTGKTRPTPYALYTGGPAFGPPRLTGLRGQTTKLTGLGGGRVLALYRRDDRPGLWAALARIDADTWVTLDEAVVWQGAASGMAGVGSGADELSELKFGFPQTTRLPDGDVFAVFWCLRDGVHEIRWARLRID